MTSSDWKASPTAGPLGALMCPGAPPSASVGTGKPEDQILQLSLLPRLPVPHLPEGACLAIVPGWFKTPATFVHLLQKGRQSCFSNC